MFSGKDDTSVHENKVNLLIKSVENDESGDLAESLRSTHNKSELYSAVKKLTNDNKELIKQNINGTGENMDTTDRELIKNDIGKLLDDKLKEKFGDLEGNLKSIENSVTQTRWLNTNFTLAADGTTGHIINSHVSFWGYDNLPSLYSAISNSSILSYSPVIDTYTMHIPFFKSKCNDTFLINHDLKLLSNNNPGVSYFRYIGETYINNSRICSWNTGYNNYAYDIDTERAYIISTNNAKGGYFNSEFMYLGADIIRQEGVNIINSNGFNIDNCLFTHNNQGIIFEYSDNIRLNNSELSFNEEVSTGVYYTNNTIIYNNIIHDNGKDGLRIYGSFFSYVSNNSIYENERHGIWCQVAQNSTLIHNSIYDTYALNYDYYFSHGSLNNTLLEPVSITNRIRATSSSGVIIRNNNNKIFGHDSSYFVSKAYPYYFCLEMKDISETITLTSKSYY